MTAQQQTDAYPHTREEMLRVTGAWPVPPATNQRLKRAFWYAHRAYWRLHGDQDSVRLCTEMIDSCSKELGVAP